MQRAAREANAALRHLQECIGDEEGLTHCPRQAQTLLDARRAIALARDNLSVAQQRIQKYLDDLHSPTEGAVTP
jgi:hypothetical protein